MNKTVMQKVKDCVNSTPFKASNPGSILKLKGMLPDHTTASKASMVNPPEPKLVPFHEAKLDSRDTKLFNGLVGNLSNGRRVEVWRTDCGGLAVRIFRPTKNGKTAKLLFGLSNDAARVLAMELLQQLLNVRV
jgi:hypothetical protein